MPIDGISKAENNSANLAHIAVLDSALADQIAAGEVVERPSSVVKELVENSLDAAATKIAITIEAGGIDHISVADNGHGIRSQEVGLSLSRHATSKVKKNLHAIRTLGFRGEALAAISAVARVRVFSRFHQESLGLEVVCEASQLLSKMEMSREVGTTVSVDDLFYNVPARKKFLKSQASETNNIIQIVHRFALANPHIHFELTVDSKKRLEYTATKDLAHRVEHVFQQGFKANISANELIQFAKTKPDAKVWGYLLPTEKVVPTSRMIFTFVNNRVVKDSLIQQAILNGAKEVLFGRNYPQLVLFLETDPEQVDVNVHPAKAEVRFQNPNQIFGLVRNSIIEALTQTKEPEADLQIKKATLSIDDSFEQESFNIPAATHFHQKREFTQNVRSSTALVSNSQQNNLQMSGPGRIRGDSLIQKPGGTDARMENVETIELAASHSAPQFVGILKNTYIVCQTDKGMMIIDQHAAHERVTYEKIRKTKLTGSSLGLLVQVNVELSAPVVQMFALHLEKLQKLGLELEIADDEVIRVKAIPAALMRKSGVPIVPIGKVIRMLADHLEEAETDIDLDSVLLNVILDVVASASCHGSVRAGQSLSEAEAKGLLMAMNETDYAGHCPHGRPTVLRFSWAELEKMFKRTL